LEKDHPDTTNINAETGTVAHEVGALCLEHNKDAESFDGAVIKGYEHVEIDAEMIENVQVYIDEIKSRMHLHCALLVEQRVDFSKWVPNGFGTSDVIILDSGVIEIHDLKYGMKKVWAEDNEQLCLYALGAYHQFSALGDFKKVRMVIHQPRLDHISEAELIIEDLLIFGERAKACAVATTAPDAGIIPGEKQCGWCKAKAVCIAAARMTAETVGMDFDNLAEVGVPTANMPDELSNDQLATIYSKLEFIENWCKGIRSAAYAALDEGREVKGYKMVAGKRGHRKFHSEDAAAKVLKGMRLKVDEMYNHKLKSPAQLEKVLKDRPRKWAKVADLITQPDGKPTIALESDKRPAIGNKADDFETLTQ
jgi:hypothetical protein